MPRCGVSSSIFYWNTGGDDEHPLLTPLERALKSVLEQLHTTNNDSNSNWIVEYWSREEYINMDTHSDIDEQLLLKAEGQIRCPDYGHVLYLEVDPEIRAPTCVFGDQLGGWSSSTTTTSLATVPAVSGRLLQFPGAAMHAVPKPDNLWFGTPQQQAKQLEAQEDTNREEGDEEEDEDFDEDQEVERSVILFNLWEDQGPGGVTEDLMAKGALPEGIGLVLDDDEGEEEDYMAREQERRVAEWNEEYGVDCQSLWCHPHEKWEPVSIAKSDLDDEGKQATILRVPLMGNKARRLHPKRHVSLSSPTSLASALEEKTTPHCFQLKTKEESE